MKLDTPLYFSRKKRFWHSVSALDADGVARALKKGADPDWRRTSGGVTPLGFLMSGARSSRAQRKRLAELLLQAGADPNLVTPREGRRGYTALNMAVASGEVDLARLLLDRGAAVDQKLGPPPSLLSVESPLATAVEWGQPRAAQLLLDSGAPLDGAVSEEGIRPLLASVAKSDHAMAEVLLKAGADVNHVHRGVGPTPLIAAASLAHVPIASLLLEHGASATRSARIKSGEGGLAPGLLPKPAQYLLGNRMTVLAWILPRRLHDVELTPVQASALGLSVEVLELLLEAGGKAEETNSDGQTAVMLASGRPIAGEHASAYVEALEGVLLFLIDKGAEVSVREDDRVGGWSALHYAIGSGSSDEVRVRVVRLLLEAGADPSVQDAEGRSPLLYARGGGPGVCGPLDTRPSSELEALLLGAGAPDEDWSR